MPSKDRFNSLLPRLTLAVLGMASFITGAVAVFITENGMGATALLTIGAVLTIVGTMGEHIESLEFGNAKLRLRAAAAAKYEEADTLAREGDLENAETLRAQARALLEAADPLATRYATVRSATPAGPERTRAMEQVVVDARRQASQQDFDPAEVARWLSDGSDERRIIALAMMQQRKELRNLDLALEAIAHSHSAFEQYHALRLVEAMVDDLDQTERRRAIDVIRHEQRGLRFRHDTDRWHLSERILNRLSEEPEDSGGNGRVSQRALV